MRATSSPRTETALGAAESFEDWNRDFIVRRIGVLLWIAVGTAVTYVVADVMTLGWDLETLGFRAISIAVIGSLLAVRKRGFVRRHVDAVIVTAGVTVTWSVLAMNAAWAASGAVEPIQSCYTAALGITLVFVANAVLLPSRWATHATLQALTIAFLFAATPQLVAPTIQASGGPWHLISVFWICVFLDLSVYLYSSLHRSEFEARKQLREANAGLRDVALQRKRYLDGLVQVGISASEAQPEFQTRAVLDAMIRLLGANRAFLHLLGPDSRLVARVGRSAGGEDLLPEEEAGSDRISVPLRMRNRPLGEVSFEISSGKGSLSAADDEFLRALASHAAIALDTVRNTEELREARDRALDSARVQNDFLENLGLELRDPLAAFADERGGSADELHETAQRLLRVVSDILELARIEGGRQPLDIQPVDVSRLGARLEAELRGAASDAENGLEVMVAEDVGALATDAEILETILRRLLDNACRFTEQGKITCHAERVDDSRVRFRVSDTGRGMDAAELAHCFDPFYRADRTRAGGFGAGLGLTTARRLCELLGGELTAQSEPERGASFIAVIPDRPEATTG